MSKTNKIKIDNKTAYCGYLYADGHAVIVHQQEHPKAGSIQWVEIFERVPCKCRFTGRIVFHNMKRDLKFKMAMQASEVRCSAECTENGSDNTRKMGLRVGSFTIEMPNGEELYWVRLPDVISDGLTYQPGDQYAETFDPEWGKEKFSWGSSKITMVHRVTADGPASVAA